MQITRQQLKAPWHAKCASQQVAAADCCLWTRADTLTICHRHHTWRHISKNKNKQNQETNENLQLAACNGSQLQQLAAFARKPKRSTFRRLFSAIVCVIGSPSLGGQNVLNPLRSLWRGNTPNICTDSRPAHSGANGSSSSHSRNPFSSELGMLCRGFA